MSGRIFNIDEVNRLRGQACLRGWDGRFGIGAWLTRGGARQLIDSAGSFSPVLDADGLCDHAILAGWCGNRIRNWDLLGFFDGFVDGPCEHDLIAPWIDAEQVAADLGELTSSAAKKPVAALKRVGRAKKDDLVLNALRPMVGEAAFAILKLIIAHDGQLSEALKCAIAARGEAIGLAALLDAKGGVRLAATARKAVRDLPEADRQAVRP